MDLEDELSRMLSDSTAGLATPVHTIIAEATRRGRVLRRRRRLGIAATALVVAGLAGGGALVGLRYDVEGDPARPVTIAAPPQPTEFHAVRNETLLGLLNAWIPPNTAVTGYNLGGSSFDQHPTQYGLSVTLQDNGGESAVQLQLRVRESGEEPTPCSDVEGDDPYRQSGADPVGCRQSVTPEGAITWQAITKADEHGIYAYDLTTLYPDGVILEIRAFNGFPTVFAEMGRTRDRPPLGITAWTDIAESPKWDLPIGAVPPSP